MAPLRPLSEVIILRGQAYGHTDELTPPNKATYIDLVLHNIE